MVKWIKQKAVCVEMNALSCTVVWYCALNYSCWFLCVIFYSWAPFLRMNMSSPCHTSFKNYNNLLNELELKLAGVDTVLTPILCFWNIQFRQNNMAHASYSIARQTNHVARNIYDLLWHSCICVSNGETLTKLLD